jgi:phage recombination protein Bet
MSNAIALRRELTPAQLDLVRKTYARDCTNEEFDLFVAQARRAGLDPFRKQITCVIHNKKNAEKRQLTIITTIDGFRAIANRHGDYRPMDTAPIVETNESLKDPVTNPEGLVRAEVRVWKRFGAEWHPIVGEAWWGEFAPFKDEWVNGDRTGRKILNDTWRNMPRLMLVKCAEAQALRRGWPDDMSGLYTEEEMERTIIDGTATEIVAHHAEEQRQKRIGGSEAVMFVTAMGQPLERVPRGHLADFCHAFIRNAESAGEIEWFLRANAESMKQFWAWEPGDALEVKRFAENRIKAEQNV